MADRAAEGPSRRLIATDAAEGSLGDESTNTDPQVPIAHPSLVEYDPHKWSIIQEEGLGGFTGVIPILDLSSTPPSTSSASSSASLPSHRYKTSQCTRSTPPPPPPALHITPHVPSDTQSDIPANEAYAIDCQHGGDEMRRWAGVGYEADGGGEVGGMVRGLWDERGWECLWVRCCLP